MKIYIITKDRYNKLFKNISSKDITNNDIQKYFNEINASAFEMLFNTHSLKDNIIIKIIGDKNE